MNLDPRTLLFSLILVYGLAVLSMFVAASTRKNSKPDGVRKWAVAMLMMAMTWGLVAARGMTIFFRPLSPTVLWPPGMR